MYFLKHPLFLYGRNIQYLDFFKICNVQSLFILTLLNDSTYKLSSPINYNSVQPFSIHPRHTVTIPRVWWPKIKQITCLPSASMRLTFCFIFCMSVSTYCLRIHRYTSRLCGFSRTTGNAVRRKGKEHCRLLNSYVIYMLLESSDKVQNLTLQESPKIGAVIFLMWVRKRKTIEQTIWPDHRARPPIATLSKAFKGLGRNSSKIIEAEKHDI